jgi:cytosine/adenosine deaminase-related metal-dependent hydrolase
LRGLANSTPPIEGVLRFGLLERTGLSVDIEVALSPDLFAQMRAVFTIQRLLANRQWAEGGGLPLDPISSRDVLKMATIGGARACGLGDRIGTLTPGKEADLILIRANDIMTGPLNSAIGTVVIGAGVEQVEAVMIGGRLRKWRGQLVGVDEAAALRTARNSRDRLAETLQLWSPGHTVL